MIFVSDIVEENGKTIRQNNLERTHQIPLGTLVQIVSDYPEYEDEDYYNGCVLFVVNHSRDCDGTPLYDLSFNKYAQKEYEKFEASVMAGDFNDPKYGNALRLINDNLLKGAILRHLGAGSLKIV
jgi:hypothetical protein